MKASIGLEPISRDTLPQEDVRQELNRILASDIFSRSERIKRFLEFAVRMTLEGKADELKEYSIGVFAFDKPEDFDPRVDPIVRVEAGRLRTKLREYYETEGRDNPMRIHFQKRSYVPRFEPHRPGAASAGARTTPEARQESPAARPSSEKHETAAQNLPTESIAVLPFADLSRQGDQEYFCDGITDELINVLSRINGLKVAARTTVMQFKGKVGDVRGIGRRLGVKAVLEGSVRTDGRRLRISTQLISVADGYTLWADVYSGEMSNIFDVQQKIAQSIVQALRIRLTDTGVTVASPAGASDGQAYRLYLQGVHNWRKGDPASLRRAVRSFEKAIVRDLDFALAHAGLSHSYASLAWAGALTPKIAWERSREAAEKALQLDATLAAALSSVGARLAAFEWDWEAAAKVFQRAIELDPSYAPSRHWNALFCLAPQGKWDEAEQELLIAGDLDPLAPAVYARLGWVRYCRRNWESALENIEKCLELDNEHYEAHSLAGYVHLARGNPEEALRAFRAALATDKRNTLAIGGAGRCHALLDQKSELKACLLDLQRRNRRGYVPETDLAQIYIGKGDIDAAFEWLFRAAERRCARLIALKADPAYDSLRNDARYERLLEQMKLESP